MSREDWVHPEIALAIRNAERDMAAARARIMERLPESGELLLSDEELVADIARWNDHRALLRSLRR